MKPILAVAAIASLAGCGTQSGNDAAPEANESNLVELPTLPLPAPPMDRAALVMAAMKAASAAASGIDDRDSQRTLDGNRFEARLRFGCSGPMPAEPKPAAENPTKSMSWSFDPEERTLRVRADPDVSMDDRVIAGMSGKDVEAVEGFWMPRPWMLEAVCPAKPKPPLPDINEAVVAKGDDSSASKVAPKSNSGEAVPPAPAEPVHSIAIAQFFGPTDSRTGRRDERPYEATKLLDEGAEPSRQGYNLVLSGRLKRRPGGRVIACQPTAVDRPPQCVISADFDRVWIERPDTREIIAEWGSGG